MYVSLIAGSIIGFLVVIVLHYIIGDARLGSVMINLALIGAVISYIFQLTSFIQLRINEPRRVRPYRSPFGIPGAIISMVLCLAGMVSIIYSGTSSYEFLASIIVAIVYFSIGAMYFVTCVQPRAVAPPTPVHHNLSNEADSIEFPYQRNGVGCT